MNDLQSQIDKLNRELKAAETRFSNVIDKNADAIVIVDDAGTVLLANPAAEKLFGRNTAEFHGRQFGYPTHSGATTEITVIGADGQRVVAEMRVVDVQWDGHLACLASIRDVTERQRLTDELRRSNKELDQFAYAVSHDLKAPLRGVTSYTQLLRGEHQGNLDEEANDFIAKILHNAERMRVLIDDLLEFARLQKQKKPPALTNFAIVFEAAVSNLCSAIDESQATVTCDELPTLAANQTQMTQLFQNLIGNGIKYRGDEPPNVHIAAKQENDRWQFTVRDNGIGIDSQHFDAVFKIFRRLHHTSEYSGTGIGLAICKKIVEQHGGRIWVESEPGKGSEFSFTIISKEPEISASAKPEYAGSKSRIRTL